MSENWNITVRGRIDGFDGLRAVATLTVVFVHMGLINKAGWMAVQEFFLMSGFLITRVLLDLKLRYGSGRFFAEFYTFRVLRIFPACFAYLALLALGTWALAPALHAQLAPQFPFLFSFTFNYSWLFTEPLRSPWIGHLWSLSVEEQFYLIWPVVIWLTPLRHLPRVLIGLVLAGPFLRLAVYAWSAPMAAQLDAHGSAIVWIVTPTYLDAFAMGALLCFDRVRQVLANIPNRLYAVAILGTIVLGLAWNAFAQGWSWRLLATLGYPVMMPNMGQFLWGYSAISLLLMVMMAKVCEHGFGRRLLCLPVLDRVGKIAYSLYLVHHGLIVFFAMLNPWLSATFGVDGRMTTLMWTPLYLLALYLIAEVSFRYIESPAMGVKRRLFARPSTGAALPTGAPVANPVDGKATP